MKEPVSDTLVAHDNLFRAKENHHPLYQESSGENHIGPLWLQTGNLSALRDRLSLEESNLPLHLCTTKMRAMNLAMGIVSQTFFYCSQSRERPRNADNGRGKLLYTPGGQRGFEPFIDNCQKSPDFFPPYRIRKEKSLCESYRTQIQTNRAV